MLNSNFFSFWLHKNKKGIYIFCDIVYDKREQSRKSRVKCRQNGELSDGRRILSAMRLPHPLPIQDDLLYVATILGRANGRRIVLPCPKGDCQIVLPMPLAWGFSIVDSHFDPYAHIKEVFL